MEYASGDMIQTPDGEAKLVGIVGGTVYAQTSDGVTGFYKIVDVSKLVVESKSSNHPDGRFATNLVDNREEAEMVYENISGSDFPIDPNEAAMDEEMTNLPASTTPLPDFTKEFLLTADIKLLEEILEEEKKGNVKFSKARKSKLRSAIRNRGGSL